MDTWGSRVSDPKLIAGDWINRAEGLLITGPTLVGGKLDTLAETTPVSQASALQDDLRRAHIEPDAWVINKSLLAAGTRYLFLRQRLLGERRQIDRVCGSMAKRVFFVPWQATPPIGLPALQELAHRDPQRRRTIKPHVTTALANSELRYARTELVRDPREGCTG